MRRQTKPDHFAAAAVAREKSTAGQCIPHRRSDERLQGGIALVLPCASITGCGGLVTRLWTVGRFEFSPFPSVSLIRITSDGL